MNRKNIGLLFTAGKHWMGGIIYIQNLIRSLDRLDETEKPNIILFYNKLSEPFLDQLEYPYIQFIELKSGNLQIGYLVSLITRKNYFAINLITSYKLDGLFPLEYYPAKLGKKSVNAVAWIPDLQHFYFPEYFSKLNWFTREMKIKHILKNATKLVLSSNTVYSQIKKEYAPKQDLEVHVLRFTSIINQNKLPNYNKVKEKYKLQEPYFIVSNQFWKHKDHSTIFKAIRLLKNKNIKCNVVFTGNMEDKRNSNYINNLKLELLKYDISDYTNFVGLIDRNEQLCIMKHSIAVIQPSLFEGWSTVIEDAKSLGVQIIASDFPVHLEQLDNGEKGFIFKSRSNEELSELLISFIKQEITPKPIFYNYEKFTLEYGKAFINMFNHNLPNKKQ